MLMVSKNRQSQTFLPTTGRSPFPTCHLLTLCHHANTLMLLLVHLIKLMLLLVASWKLLVQSWMTQPKWKIARPIKHQLRTQSHLQPANQILMSCTMKMPWAPQGRSLVQGGHDPGS